MAVNLVAASSQSLTNESAPATATPLTLACWFNSNDITTGYYIFGLANSADQDPWFVLLVQGNVAGDPIRASHRDTAPTPVEGLASSTTGYSANTWHHACGVFTSANSRSVYLDGGSKGTNTTSVGTTPVNRVGIGVLYRPTPVNYFDGKMAEAAIWDAALTDDEVVVLAKGYSPLFVRPQNLVAYWPLIRNLTQDKINGYTLTEVNTPTVANHPRVLYPSNTLIRHSIVNATYTSYGMPFLYTSANWASPTIYLEVYMKASAETAYARLYDETSGVEVTNSELFTVSTSLTRLRSAGLTLTNGNIYRIQYGAKTSGSGAFISGKLIIT